MFENLRGYNNQYEQLYSRVKYHKFIDKLTQQDVEKLLIAVGISADLCETYIQYSGGNTRKLEHLITHSINVAKINNKEIDKAIIKQSSRLIMV